MVKKVKQTTKKTVATKAATPGIGGLYVLGAEKWAAAKIKSMIQSDNGIGGISIRYGWIEIESANGAYKWVKLDAAVAAAESVGGKIMLRVIPGVHTPPWVYVSGAKSVQVVENNQYADGYGKKIKAPVPWDGIYLSLWLRFVRAIGKRYNGRVQIVAVTGPAAGGEMHLVDQGDQTTWQAAGYTEQKLSEAWMDTINMFRSAFPKSHKSMALSNPVAFGSPALLLNSMQAYCRMSQIGVQGNWLSAKTRRGFVPYDLCWDHQYPVGFQMLCASSQERFGGTLKTAMARAQACPTITFLELYPADVTVANMPLLRKVAEELG